MAERTLACVLLGTSRVCTASIDRDCLVGELKNVVKRKLALTCAADLLELYVVPGVLVEALPAATGSAVPATAREDIARFEYNGVPVSPAELYRGVVSNGTALPASRELQCYLPAPMDTDALSSKRSLDDAIEIAVKAPEAALSADAASESDMHLVELKELIECVAASHMSASGMLTYSLDALITEIRLGMQWTDAALQRMDACGWRLAKRTEALTLRVLAAAGCALSVESTQ